MRADDAKKGHEEQDMEMDDDGVDLMGFDAVDKLQQHGVNVSDIKKLKDAGITTVGFVGKTARKVSLSTTVLSQLASNNHADLDSALLPSRASGLLLP